MKKLSHFLLFYFFCQVPIVFLQEFTAKGTPCLTQPRGLNELIALNNLFLKWANTRVEQKQEGKANKPIDSQDETATINLLSGSRQASDINLHNNMPGSAPRPPSLSAESVAWK